MYTTQYLHPSLLPHPQTFGLPFDGLAQHARVPYHHGVFNHALPPPPSNALWNPGSVCLSPEDPESGRDVTIKLVEQAAWERFAAHGTEMIITKLGRRPFPYAKIAISGLNPTEKYMIGINVVRVDSKRYKYTNSVWQENGDGERIDPRMEASTIYFHPEGPMAGSEIMKKGYVNFVKVKLTNNTNHQPRDTHMFHLHSGHKYRLQFMVCRVGPAQFGFMQPAPVPVKTITPAITEFIAVTAYQNEKVTALKIELNPFAKGFRENGGARKRKRNQTSETNEEEESKRRKLVDNEGDKDREEEEEQKEHEEEEEQEEEEEEDEIEPGEESCSPDVNKTKSSDRPDAHGCDSGVECCGTPNSVAAPEDNLRPHPISPSPPTHASPAPALQRSDSVDSGQGNPEKVIEKMDTTSDQSASKEMEPAAKDASQSPPEGPSVSTSGEPSEGGKTEKEPKPKKSPQEEPAGHTRKTPSSDSTTSASQKHRPKKTLSPRISCEASSSSSSSPALQLEAVSPSPSSASPRDCPSRESTSRSSQGSRRSVSVSDRYVRDAVAIQEIHRIAHASQAFARLREEAAMASPEQCFPELFPHTTPVSVPISMAQYSSRHLANLHIPNGYLSLFSDLRSSYLLPTSTASLSLPPLWPYPSPHYALPEAVTSSHTVDALQRYSMGLADRRLSEDSLQLGGLRVGAVDPRLAAIPNGPHSPPIRRPVPVWPTSVSGVSDYLPRSHHLATSQLPHLPMTTATDRDLVLRLQQDLSRNLASYRPLQLAGQESSCDSTLSADEQERTRCWTLPEGRPSVLSTPPQDRGSAHRDS